MLVLCSGLLGVHFGGLQITTAAWGELLGGPGAVAPLVAVSSGAGLIGAWLCGLSTWRTAPLVQVVLAACGVAVGCALVALASAVPGRGAVGLLALGLALAGLVVPVVVVQVAVVLEREVPRAVLTEALAWTGSASAAGSATGAAAVGRVVDGAGPGVGAAGLVVVALLLALGALTAARWRCLP